MLSRSSDLTRRDQRTIESRLRILEATIACLAEEGCSGASTLRIQERADVSRGRLLHHFPTRQGLLVAAAERLAGERIGSTIQLDVAALQSGADPESRIPALIEGMWQEFHLPRFWARMELWVAARTDVVLAGLTASREAAARASVSAVVDRAWGPALARRPRYPELRDLLLSSMYGVALTYAFHPRDPRDEPHLPMWIALARALLTQRPSNSSNSHC